MPRRGDPACLFSRNERPDQISCSRSSKVPRHAHDFRTWKSIWTISCVCVCTSSLTRRTKLKLLLLQVLALCWLINVETSSKLISEELDPLFLKDINVSKGKTIIFGCEFFCVFCAMIVWRTHLHQCNVVIHTDNDAAGSLHFLSLNKRKCCANLGCLFGM